MWPYLIRCGFTGGRCLVSACDLGVSLRALSLCLLLGAVFERVRLGKRGSVSLTRPSTSNNAFAGMTVTTARNNENRRNVMKNMSGKIVAWLNDALRDYVYGPRRWFSPLRIVFVVMVAFVASLVGSAFAHYMVHATVDNGTFEDGYMARYMFEVGSVAFIVVAMLTRRMFRALCAAYVRRLDMDDAIRTVGVKPNASNADTKSAPSRSRGYAGIANGDYVSAVDSREGTISESEGGDA